MPVFIALGTATDSGIKDLDSLTARHEGARRRARDLGGRVLDSYATLGRYDFDSPASLATTNQSISIVTLSPVRNSP